MNTSIYNHIIYTDGSCSNNHTKKEKRVGGWAFVILDNSFTETDSNSGKVNNQPTNNSMEIKAVIESLLFLKKQNKTNEKKHIEIVTDSTYVKDNIGNMIKWKNNKWTKKGQIKNLELWKELSELVSLFYIDWRWTKSHKREDVNDRDSIYNNRVDKMAKKEAGIISKKK